MILSGLDVALGLIALVIVGRDELLNNPRRYLVAKALDAPSILVVHALKMRYDPMTAEESMTALVGGNMADGLAVGHSLKVNIIEARHDEKILGPRGAPDGELTGEVRVPNDLGHVDTGHGRGARDGGRVQVGLSVTSREVGGLSAATAVLGLPHVALGRGHRVRGELTNQSVSQARELETKGAECLA